jgi:hypothetical protein
MTPFDPERDANAPKSLAEACPRHPLSSRRPYCPQAWGLASCIWRSASRTPASAKAPAGKPDSEAAPHFTANARRTAHGVRSTSPKTAAGSACRLLRPSPASICNARFELHPRQSAFWRSQVYARRMRAQRPNTSRLIGLTGRRLTFRAGAEARMVVTRAVRGEDTLKNLQRSYARASNHRASSSVFASCVAASATGAASRPASSRPHATMPPSTRARERPHP